MCFTNTNFLSESAWRHSPGTATNPHTINFKGKDEELKGFISGCLGGYNPGDYSMPTKEVAEYIGSKFRYRADIQ